MSSSPMMCDMKLDIAVLLAGGQCYGMHTNLFDDLTQVMTYMYVSYDAGKCHLV